MVIVGRFRLVVEQGMRPVIAGAAIGLAASAAVTRLTQSLLFGVDALDPATYVVALAALGSIAIAACVLPALRATRVDPVLAIKT